MAAQLIMPTLPSDQQQSRHFLPSGPVHAHHHHHHLRSTSHSHHAATNQQHQPLRRVFTSSPPSPPGSLNDADADDNNSVGTRPLYMPAVLRPNYEFAPPPHHQQSPLSASPGTSSESSGSETTIHRRTHAANLLSLAGLGAIGHRLGRRSNPAESSKSLEGDWDLTAYPDVTSPPTRQHWKPDTESSICDDPLCMRSFSYFNRRHHCRKCGNIFCDGHSRLLLPLDQDANFNPRADPSRTCNHCFEQVRARHGGHRRDNEQSASKGEGGAAAVAVAAGSAASEFGLPRNKDMAASMPRDWNWSTF